MHVYDFDKTIYHGDSTMDFVTWCLKKKPSLALRLLPGTVSFGAYLIKQSDKTRFKEKFYAFLRYIPRIDDWVEAFWQLHNDRIKDWYLLQQQEDDVIISASPEFLLRPICRQLGIKHLIASRVDIHTGMYLGLNCYGEEKVRRFRKVFPDAQIEDFYSDSYSDDPLARIAHRAILVKGDQLLPWNK